MMQLMNAYFQKKMALIVVASLMMVNYPVVLYKMNFQMQNWEIIKKINLSTSTSELIDQTYVECECKISKYFPNDPNI